MASRGWRLDHTKVEQADIDPDTGVTCRGFEIFGSTGSEGFAAPVAPARYFATFSVIPFMTDLSVVSSADVMTVGVPTVSITI
jgi:hypothetical protein